MMYLLWCLTAGKAGEWRVETSTSSCEMVLCVYILHLRLDLQFILFLTTVIFFFARWFFIISRLMSVICLQKTVYRNHAVSPSAFVSFLITFAVKADDSLLCLRHTGCSRSISRTSGVLCWFFSWRVKNNREGGSPPRTPHHSRYPWLLSSHFAVTTCTTHVRPVWFLLDFSPLCSISLAVISASTCSPALPF